MLPDPPPGAARLNPLTLLCGAVAIAGTTTAVNSWLVSAAVLLGLAVLLALTGLGRKVLPAAAVIMVPFGLSLLITHGLFFHEGRTVLWEAGAARVTVEGLGFAADMGLRTAVFVVVFLAFSFSVQPADLMALLARYQVTTAIRASDAAFTPSRNAEATGELRNFFIHGAEAATNINAGRKMPIVASVAPGTPPRT